MGAWDIPVHGRQTGLGRPTPDRTYPQWEVNLTETGQLSRSMMVNTLCHRYKTSQHYRHVQNPKHKFQGKTHWLPSFTHALLLSMRSYIKTKTPIQPTQYIWPFILQGMPRQNTEIFPAWFLIVKDKRLSYTIRTIYYRRLYYQWRTRGKNVHYKTLKLSCVYCPSSASQNRNTT